MAKKINNSSDPAQARALAVADFACFCTLVSPGFELAPHIDYLCHRLEALEAAGGPLGKLKRLVGKRQDRLILSMPPQNGKTLLVSGLFSCWYMGRHPDRSVILASYSQDRVDDVGRAVRAVMISPEFQAVFPGCRMQPDTSAAKRFDLTAGGSFYAVGRGGPTTGRGCNLLICDDLLKDAEEARSEVVKKGLVEWFQSVAFTRLQPGGQICIVATRWAEDDLSGWLLKEHASEGWDSVNLPALSEGPGDLLNRPEGVPLWPSRFSLETLNGIRRQIGPNAWMQLYMGRPSAAGGTIFKREWFRVAPAVLPAFTQTIIAADTSFGVAGKAGDYSCLTVWQSNASAHYLIHVSRKRLDFPALQAHLRELCVAYRPAIVLVEAAASGHSLVQSLAHSTSYPIKAVPVAKSKETRAAMATPLYECGKVFHVDAPWRESFESELCAFPFGRWDDQVDSASLALNYLREWGYGMDSPPPFLTGEPCYSIQALRDYLSGNVAGPISAATSKAVCDGRVSGVQEDEIILSTLRPGALE